MLGPVTNFFCWASSLLISFVSIFTYISDWSIIAFFVGLIIFNVVFSPEDKEKDSLKKSDRELALIKEREFIKSEVAKSKARDAEVSANKENK